MTSNRRTVIAHHLILSAYGHWLPNDSRGSGSDFVRKGSLSRLGTIHQGRKRVQPPRSELKAFYSDAEPLLEHETLWFDAPKRQALAEAFAQVVKEQRYTCYGCAVLHNHAHLCIRRHKDSRREMWSKLARSAADGLRLFADVSKDHRIWSERPYTVFLYTPEDVNRTIRYIRSNLEKHNVPEQRFDFVTSYDNWPVHRQFGG